MVRPAPRLALFVCVHVVLAAVGFWADRWYVWAFVWAVQAMNFLTTIAVVHECAHLRYFSGRRANHVTGVALAAIGLACFESYRSQHIVHHADTCGENDPEGEPYRFTSRWQIAGAFLGGGLAYALLLLGQGIVIALGYTPAWLSADGQRRRIRINVAVLTVAAVGLAALVVGDFLSLRGLTFVWLIPAAVALIGPIPFVLIPEHYDAPGPGPAFMNTRTCTSNAVVRFLYLNTNLHTAHHHRPALPWYDLPAHHRQIEDEIEPTWLFPSYTAFHRFMWRTTGRSGTHASRSVDRLAGVNPVTGIEH